MKGKITILTLAVFLITGLATANDYIIQDSNSNNLFVVNESGEKQIQNGNLYLKGNSIVDNQGDLNLDGGNVNIPNGDLKLGGDRILDVNNVQADSGTNLQIKTGGNGGNSVDIVDKANGGSIISANEGGNVKIPNGNLDMSGNSIQNVGSLSLGWQNLTDYPAGCGTEEAVRVVGDTLDCVSLNPGGTVETGGGSKGQVAFFLDSENITGSNNLYWNNSQVEMGIGTNNPSANLDVNGDIELSGGLDAGSSTITNIGDLQGSGIVGNNQIASGAITSGKIGGQEVTSGELNTGVAGTGLSGGGGSSLSVNTGTGLTTNSDNVLIDTSVVPRKGQDESISASRWTFQNDLRVQGNLDVWGNIQNTDVTNLNINGSLLPPSGYSDTFDVGSSSRRWRTGYFQDLSLGSGSVDNGELANSQITINTNTGLSGGGDVSLGNSVGISHADVSSQSDVDNSGGTVIQDLYFDNGHVTNLATSDLDNRYYTQGQVDNNFVGESGDTVNGILKIDDSSDGKLQLSSSDVGSTSGTPEGGWNYIEFHDGQFDRQGYFGIDSGGNFQFSPEVSGGVVEVESDLDVSGNSINNFFGTNCGSDEVVKSVNSDGTYNCQSITGAADDSYVNEAGDTMTGYLNMSGNNITDVDTLRANTLKRGGETVHSLYVDESGDSMSGQLNMQGNNLENVGTLDFNSVGTIQSDNTDAINIDGSQNIEVPNGNIGIGTTPSVGEIHIDKGDDSSKPGIFAQDPTAGSGYGAKFVYNDANGQNELALLVRDGGSDTRGLVIDRNSANVQIPNGQLDLGSSRITSVQDPSNAQDAATKSYVDTEVSNAESSATQNLNQVLSEGNDANSQAMKNVGVNNIDLGDGEGDINMNGQRIESSGLVQASSIGVTNSLSTAENEVSGNSIYVEDDVSVDGDFVGAGADVAEKIETDSRIEPGTVVEISGDMKVEKSEEARDTDVAGVVSTDPAMIMAKSRDGVPVAMSGTVPVKFSDEKGDVTPGDFLTTASKDGHAMKCNDINSCEGAVIGKAMESQSGDGEVEILISRG